MKDLIRKRKLEFLKKKVEKYRLGKLKKTINIFVILLIVTQS